MYTQSEKTRYNGNEFANMPSVDCCTANDTTLRLDDDHMNLIDLDKVKEICNKYGLKYTIISDTFCCYGHRGNYEKEFIVYYKPNFTEEYYQSLIKKEDYDKLRELYRNEIDNIKNLHECVHELDEQTLLYFETGWAGNVGLYGSNDVNVNVYCHCDSFTSWKSILDYWAPSIHDTLDKLTKGVYVMAHTSYYKKKFVKDTEE